MSIITDRISAWQAAGLIDAATATALRAAEDADREGDEAPDEPTAAEPARSRARSFRFANAFGPVPSIPEMFSYLGGAFLIAAYSMFLARIAGYEDRAAILAAGSGLGTLMLGALGLWLARGDDRRRRAGGVLLFVAADGAAVTAVNLAQLLGWDSTSLVGLFVALVALGAGVLGRRLIPAVMTQLAVLVGITAVGAASMAVIHDVLMGSLGSAAGAKTFEPSAPVSSDLLRDVLLPAAGWLLVALVIGVVGLWEARRHDPAADRRASVTRLWAGLTAVFGLWLALAASGDNGRNEYGRILEPWIGDVALLVLAAVLVERAFRRDAAAFILPAAVGLVTALTDFNFSYLSGSTDVGLVIEGVILLAVGFAADRLRRRLDRSNQAGTPADRQEPAIASGQLAQP